MSAPVTPTVPPTVPSTVTKTVAAAVTATVTALANAGRVYLSAMRAGWADYRSLYTWRSWLFGWVVRVVSQVAFFAVIGHLLGSHERVRYLLIGSAVAIAVMEALMAMSFMSAERGAGTLPLVVASGSSPVLVLAGRTAFLMGTATVSASISLAVTAPLFGVAIPWRHAWAVLALIAVVAVASHSLALFITGLSMKFLQFGTLLNGMVFLPMLAVCGAVVPVSVWPGWVQQVSVFLPLTHGLAGVRELFDGGAPGVLLAAAGRELSVAAGWLILAALAFRLFIERARRTGQLDYAE
jgi:ABC-2 type transport system permease protein